jgi:hypothetical protein
VTAAVQAALAMQQAYSCLVVCCCLLRATKNVVAVAYQYTQKTNFYHVQRVYSCDLLCIVRTGGVADLFLETAAHQYLQALQ